MEIYNVGNRVMNTYIYHTAAGYVMIDTGYEHCLRSVEKRLRKKGIAMSAIKYVFLTHAHDDHAGFLNELLASYPAIKVIISQQAIPILLKGQNSFAGGCSGLSAFLFCKWMALAGKGNHLFPAIERLYLNRLIAISPQNQSELEAVLQGKILFTPGHTSDSISLEIDNMIFCGDAAMNGVPSFRRITIWIEDKNLFYQSWDVLIAEKAERIYPAHGKPFRRDDLIKYKRHIPKVKLYELTCPG